MVWAINSLGNPRIKRNLRFRKSLFKRLGLLVFVFTIALTSVLYYQLQYSFTAPDSILDAHETYYYSEMVSKWGNPPDTNQVSKEINNLKMWCGIFKRETTELGIAYPGETYWSNLPYTINPEEFIQWHKSSEFEILYDINIHSDVFFGEINSMPVTVVDNGNHLFYLVIDYIPPA